ncbi:MAG: Kelch repeat-containing protein [Butyricimonas virosa]
MRTLNFWVLVVLGLIFASCDDDHHLGDWEKSVEFGGAPREAAVCFTDPSTGTVFVSLGLGAKSVELTDTYYFNDEDGTLNWKKVDSEFPADPNPGKGGVKNGNGRHSAVAFVIGDTAYVGTGFVPAFVDNNGVDRDRTYFNDFYKFNLKTKKWESGKLVMNVNGVPVEGRRDAIAFSDGEYGYVGTGYGENNRVFKDFYRFDPKTGTWEEISFLGESRYGGTVFVVNKAAYVCLGSKSVGGVSNLATDVVKFDFETKTWEKMFNSLTDKPGVKQDKDYDRIPRAYAISFVSNAGSDGEEYAYVATGSGNNARTVWKYNHKKDQWHQMEDLSDMANLLVMGVGFTYKGFGYYTTGGSGVDNSDNLYTDTWKFIPDVKETRRNDY